MLIHDILNGVKVLEILNYDSSIDIQSINDNSSKIEPNSLFVCIKGVKNDGHNFAKDAVNNGAIALVVEEFIKDVSVMQIRCENNRKVLATCCNNFYKDILSKLSLIGITGTNGKTTVTYMINSILLDNVGVIGTTGAFYKDKKITTNLTTPDCLDIYRIFDAMVKDGVNTIVMEISAHAIALYKVYGLKFKIGIFTNLTQDHLDFFGDIESYYSVKAGFIMDQCENKIINVDDVYGRQLYTLCCEPKYSYALNSPADIFAIDIEYNKYGSKYIANVEDELYEVKCNIPNDYNIANSLCAIYAGVLMGLDLNECAKRLSMLYDIPGRMKIIQANGFDVIVDYAHTPDGLEKLLQNVKTFNYSNIIVVFGSCGYRDSLKRSIMGKVVSSLCDFCYITSDNPRYENPMDIALSVANGCINDNYEIELDRELAIGKAFEKVNKGGVVVCCGKSTDIYQDIRGKKIAYNEVEIINNLINKYIK